MAAEITMPNLGATTSTATIVRWFKQPGERLSAGEPLLEVATDKINYEIESPAGGRLTAQLGREGDAFAGGSPLGVIELDEGHVMVAGTAVPVATGDAAWPAHGDAAWATGNGQERAALDAAPSPARSASRRELYEAMAAVGMLPLSSVETTARVDDLAALLARRLDAGWTAFAVYAAARTLRDHPALRVDATTGRPFDRIDVAVAVDAPRGAVAPVIRGADRLALAEVEREVVRLAAAARAGTLRGGDAFGACFTISNVGPQGVERIVPLVHPPQTAVLGMGAATRRAVVVKQPGTSFDATAPAWTVSLVTTFDHRFVDGAPAARFLAALAAAFADPAALL